MKKEEEKNGKERREGKRESERKLREGKNDIKSFEKLTFYQPSERKSLREEEREGEKCGGRRERGRERKM